MEIASIIDQELPVPHGNRKGLSYGQLSVLFLSYVASQSDHRLCAVEPWVFLLTIALRCFTLIEFQVRRQLQTQQDEIAGLYAGNPKRKTQRPTAERLLKAFENITLYHHRDGTCEITPLNDLQRRILQLMKIPDSIYELPVST